MIVLTSKAIDSSGQQRNMSCDLCGTSSCGGLCNASHSSNRVSLLNCSLECADGVQCSAKAAGHIQEERMDELTDDLLLEILNCVPPAYRQVLSSVNKRLNALCHGTFTSMAVTLPWDCGKQSQQDSPEVEAARFWSHSMPAARFDTIRKLVLKVKMPTDEELQLRSDVSGVEGREEQPWAPINTWMHYFFGGSPKEHVETIRLRPLVPGPSSKQLPMLGSYALRTLALGCPNLRSLSLPLVPRSASSSLTLLTQLHSLSLTVADGSAINSVLKLTQLRSLSMATAKNLFYLILQQQQVEQLSCCFHLASIHLQHIMLHDSHSTFTALSSLVSLLELRSSYPLSPAHLCQLPSLQSLHVPLFSSSMGDLGYFLPGLTELRLKQQALRESDLIHLTGLSQLHTLHCDSILLSSDLLEMDASYIHAFLNLPAVRVLRMTGNMYHNGVMGLLFPNLEVLQASNVLLTSPHPSPVEPLPRLRHLSWPATKATPFIVTAASALTSLQLLNISCAARLEEVTSLERLPPGLTSMLLEFSGCQARFRAKQVKTLVSKTPSSFDQLTCLTLKDESIKDPMEPGKMVDDHIIAAVLARFKNLRELRLLNCGLITNIGLRTALSDASPKLECIIVGACPLLRRQALELIPMEIDKHWIQLRWHPNIEGFC